MRKGLAAGIFAWVFVTGLLAKLFRAWGLWADAEASDGFVWLPLGLAAEVLAATLATAVALGVARGLGRLLPGRPAVGARAGAGVGFALALLNTAWLGLNLASFNITQAPITFQRLRGDEGVAFAGHHLITWSALVPVVAFGVTALLVAPLALFAGPRAARLLPARARASVLALALGAYGFDAFVTRDENFGVADHPAFTLASSFARASFDAALEARLEAPLERGRPADPLATVFAGLGAQTGDAPPPPPDLAELLRARTPLDEVAPPPTARASMKNVIVFFAEGIPRKHTSLGGDNDTTPNLARRAQQDGLELTRWYAPYHKSIAAIFSFLCSRYPPSNGQSIVELNPRMDCGELSDVLSENGFHTGLFHGGDFGFYDKLMLLGMRHYEVLKDARQMSDPLRYDEHEWGIDDRALVDHLLAWIDELPPADRFGAVLIPITAHWPYWLPGDVEPDFPGLSSKNKFLSAVSFSDRTFELLMRGLEERGLDDETAVIFLADHGETVGERPRASAGVRLAYEPSLHTPFVLIAPGMWPAGARSDRLASHVDLLPTILDVLGLPPDPRHQGRSVLEPDRDPQRVFVGANNGTRWVGFIDGSRKVVVNRTTRTREIYDLSTDPDERKNLARLLPAADIDEVVDDALAFSRGHLAELKVARRLQEDFEIEQRFVELADVRIRIDASMTVASGEQEQALPHGVHRCVRVPDEPGGRRECPGDEPGSPGLFQGRRVVRASGRHDCILVRPPRTGVLEIEVRDQPWLPFLTRVRAAVTPKLRTEGDDEVPLEAWVDGDLHGSRTLEPGEPARIPFSAPRESLLLRIGGSGEARRDVCLTLTDRAWRNKAPPVPFVLPDTPAALPARPMPLLD
jgi:arylsulfatase A-like enzyme